MKTERLKTETHEQKLERAIASRTTRLSIYQIQSLALELSRCADGTISPQAFEHNFDWSFNFLCEAEKRLMQFQKQNQENANLPTE